MLRVLTERSSVLRSIRCWEGYWMFFVEGWIMEPKGMPIRLKLEVTEGKLSNGCVEGLG